MGQHHHHGHHHAPDATDSVRDIRFAFFLNLGFALAEIAGGLWTNSLAILSDALHDFGDSIILGLSWYLERYSRRERSDEFSYGYRRFSLLGALVNVVILIAGSLFIIVEAIPRIMNPAEPDAVGMMWFAIAGVLLNGVAALRLGRGRSMSSKVVAWHMLEDVLGWIAVLIVSIVMQFTYLPVLDPILSLLIASYILYYNVFSNFSSTLRLFLQGVPREVDARDIERRILEIEHVLSVHHLHVWSLDGERHVLTAHVVIDSSVSREGSVAVKQQIKDLSLTSDIGHITLEVEYPDEDCVMGEGVDCG